MPPVRTAGGRASKACEGCRKGKTRCYTSSSGSCLRCNTLRLQCSLRDDLPDLTPLDPRPHSPSAVQHDRSLIPERVATLERTVLKLSEAIGLDIDQQAPARFERPLLHHKNNDSRVAPLLVIRDAASESVLPFDPSHGVETIVDKGLVTADEARQLLAIFRTHYRRWIALREPDENEESDVDYRDSPLLLCACCLISVRHWSSERARHIVDLLFAEAKSLLSQQVLKSPQRLQFFQAVLVLSLWSTTIGQKPLSIDSWMITGFALQHGLASDAFDDMPDSARQNSEPRDTIGRLLLWNRLCLAHLYACIGMRRTSMIRKAEIERIQTRLPLGELSNFELRMIAEVDLYCNTYKVTVAEAVPLPQAQAALQSCRHKCAYLFDQPRSQFLQMGFHFTQLLVFEQSLNNKSAAVRESLLSEMVRLCSTILRLAMETTDERTKHLTDHVYHMITFAAVTLCRLLCKYEAQLRTRMNVSDCDLLICQIVSWLQTLGSPLHVGHTLGGAIDAAHRKLRPGANLEFREDSKAHEEEPDLDLAMFPELFGMGMDTYEIDWDAILPDWQSLASDDPSHTATQLT